MKVLLVDDHPLARRGLHVVVTSNLGTCKMLEADHASAALDLAHDERPDMVLLDARMPDSSPPDRLCRQLRELVPNTTIVIVTAFDDLAVIRACLSAGANGCLLKDTSELDIGAALRALLAGEFVIDPRIAKELAREARAPHREGTRNLTNREHDVLALLARGYSNRKIAQQLFLSETTVKGYVTDILQKLDASSRLEAVVHAFELGVVAQPSPR